MVSQDKTKRVVEVAERELLTPYGLRSLALPTLPIGLVMKAACVTVTLINGRDLSGRVKRTRFQILRQGPA